jgi:hypothetical protein
MAPGTPRVAGHGSALDTMRTSTSLPCPGHLLAIDALHHWAYRHERASFGVRVPPDPGDVGGVQATRRDGLLSRRQRFLHPAVPILMAARAAVLLWTRHLAATMSPVTHVANVAWPSPGECFRMIYSGFNCYPTRCPATYGHSGQRFSTEEKSAALMISAVLGGPSARYRSLGSGCMTLRRSRRAWALSCTMRFSSS